MVDGKTEKGCILRELETGIVAQGGSPRNSPSLGKNAAAIAAENGRGYAGTINGTIEREYRSAGAEQERTVDDLMTETVAFLNAADWLHAIGVGALGGFVVVAAHYFVSMGLKLEQKSRQLQLLYVLGGGSVSFGFSLFELYSLSHGFFIGAFWPYPLLAAKISYENVANGQKLRQAGVTPHQLIEAVQKGTGIPESDG